MTSIPPKAFEFDTRRMKKSTRTAELNRRRTAFV